MNSSLSSGHLSAFNDQLSPAYSSLNVPSEATAANRKRRRAPAHLDRIDLVLRSSLNANNNFIASSLSIGAVDVLNVAERAIDRQLSSTSTASASASASDDEADFVSAADDDHQVAASFVSSLGVGDEYEKRSRLTGIGDSGSNSASIRASPLHLFPRMLSSAATYSEKLNGPTDGHSNNTNTSDDYYDLAELECAQNSSVGSTNGKVSGSLRIGDGVFELVGDGGRECKAVNIHTQAVYHCQIFKLEEYKNFVEVINRLESARQWYEESDLDEMKSLIIPEGTEIIRGDNDLCYVLTPDHFGNLHTLIHATLPHSSETDGGRKNSRPMALEERRIQAIFKQIVALVRFCHAIGIYFRDFRLRKFVFVDRKQTIIRINSVLDLCVGASVEDDQMTERHVCPAYVAPEILDVRSRQYAGRPADVWALGVLMFILLTDHYPFYDQNHSALFRRIRARRLSFPIPEKISSNARWLLHALLRLDPADRPSAADVLHSHWLQTDSDFLSNSVEQYSSTMVQRISINDMDADNEELTFVENDRSVATPNNNNNNNANIDNNTVMNGRIDFGSLERSFSVQPIVSMVDPSTILSLGLRPITFNNETTNVTRQLPPRRLNVGVASVARTMAAAPLQQALQPLNQRLPAQSVMFHETRPIINRPLAISHRPIAGSNWNDQLVPSFFAKTDKSTSNAIVAGGEQ